MKIYHYTIPGHSAEPGFDVIIVAESLPEASRLATAAAIQGSYSPDALKLEKTMDIPTKSKVIFPPGSGEDGLAPEYIKLRGPDGSTTLIEKLPTDSLITIESDEDSFWGNVTFYSRVLGYNREGDLTCLCIDVDSPRDADKESIGRRQSYGPYQQSQLTITVYPSLPEMEKKLGGRKIT